MITEENLKETLKFFGLEGDDADIYLGLLRIGDTTVGNLSAQLEIDRGRTYRTLTKLENLGLIINTLSNPRICQSVKPEEAFKGIIQKKRDEITTMEKLSSQIIATLEGLKRPSPDNSVSASFSIIQGRTNIYTRVGKMVTESTNVVYLVSTVDDIMRMYHTAIPEKIKECKKNGGVIRIITESENRKTIELIQKLGATETRLGKLPSQGRMIAEKDKQIIMSGSMRGTMDLNDDSDSIIHTNSTEIVNNIFSLCEHLWKKAKPIEVEFQ